MEDFAEEISAGLSGGNLIGFHVLEGNDGEAVDLMVESESLRYLEGYLEEVAHYDPERPTLRPMRTSLPPTWPGAQAVVITDK